MASIKHLRIGVFIPTTVQLLDLSPIDIFGMIDPAYLTVCELPAPLVALGIPSTIHYISVTGAGSQVQLTASASIRVSKSIKDKEVQPGMLDIILIPGPPPDHIFKEEVLEFLRGHAQWRGGKGGLVVDILSVCTGRNLLGQAGILKGKSASVTRAMTGKVKKEFPDTKWVDDKRWVHDGNIWSSGGITNGQEMVAAYLRENYPGPAVEAVLAMADVGEKGINYTKSKPVETLWWLWQILRAATFGNGKQKKTQ